MQAPQQTAPAQDPQWIPVPPPNPYATGTAQPATGKGLAITAMALGLLALFSSIVAGLYFSVFVVLAAFVALVAVIMGIVALVKRSNPKGAAITGLISGALAIVVSLVIGIVSVASVTSELITGATPGLGQDSNEGETSED